MVVTGLLLEKLFTLIFITPILTDMKQIHENLLKNMYFDDDLRIYRYFGAEAGNTNKVAWVTILSDRKSNYTVLQCQN